MKHVLWAVAMAVAIVAGPAAATGVPVVDVAGLAQAMEQFTKLTEQLDQLKKQYETAKSQLASLKEQSQTIQNMYNDFKGVTDHARMLADSVQNFHDFSPESLMAAGDMISGELGTAANQIRSAREKFSADVLFPGTGNGQAREKQAYQEQGDHAFAWAAQAKTAYEGFAQRRAQLESLGSAAATATTPNAKLDLIGRSNAELALLLNDLAMMQALQMGAQAEAAIVAHNADGLQRAGGMRAADVRFPQ
jgi:type IV secretion system protein VirB5